MESGARRARVRRQPLELDHAGRHPAAQAERHARWLGQAAAERAGARGAQVRALTSAARRRSAGGAGRAGPPSAHHRRADLAVAYARPPPIIATMDRDGRSTAVALAMGVAGAVLLIAALAVFSSSSGYGYDLAAYLSAAARVAAGGTPYQPQTLNGPFSPGPAGLYLYPPPLAVLLAAVSGVATSTVEAGWWIVRVGLLVVGCAALPVPRWVRGGVAARAGGQLPDPHRPEPGQREPARARGQLPGLALARPAGVGPRDRPRAGPAADSHRGADLVAHPSPVAAAGLDDRRRPRADRADAAVRRHRWVHGLPDGRAQPVERDRGRPQRGPGLGGAAGRGWDRASCSRPSSCSTRSAWGPSGWRCGRIARSGS